MGILDTDRDLTGAERRLLGAIHHSGGMPCAPLENDDTRLALTRRGLISRGHPQSMNARQFVASEDGAVVAERITREAAEMLNSRHLSLLKAICDGARINMLGTSEWEVGEDLVRLGLGQMSGPYNTLQSSMLGKRVLARRGVLIDG